MFQKSLCATTESRSRAGPISVRSLASAAAIIAAGLGLAACVGPYHDGYGHTRLQYQTSPNYYENDGYQQRRDTRYRQYPYTSPDQQRWYPAWWSGADYSRDRYSYER